MVEIDGSFGEGGGQIVRTACALAVLTRRSCHIFHIRQGRREPGLRLQHLHAVCTLAELSGGSAEGARVGSDELIFTPAGATANEIHVRLETASSITLIAQCLIPAMLSASKPVRVTFRGGATDTAFAPPLDYFRYVFLRFLKRIGLEVNVNAPSRGYYPKGGAEVVVEFEPARPKPIVATERGALRTIRVFSSAAAVLRQRRVAERQVEGALRSLSGLPLAPVENVEYSHSFSAGSALCIVAEFESCRIGASSLGARGKMAEQVGSEAAERFLEEFNCAACLDRHMADQILPYMALAGSGSRVTVAKVTEHCRTNMWVIEKFLEGKFEVREPLISWSPRRAA